MQFTLVWRGLNYSWLCACLSFVVSSALVDGAFLLATPPSFLAGKQQRPQQHLQALRTQLFVASAADSSADEGFFLQEGDDIPVADHRTSMPWSQLQDWALRDQVPKYTVVIPIQKGEGKDKTTKHEAFILWRTMLEEVVELAGYPIDFLQEMLKQQQKQQNNSTTSNLAASSSLSSVLPFLDDYEFESSGGLSGRVFGVRGVADGTQIQTTPVGNVKVTVPKGFVLTEDGSVAYELGRPLGAEILSVTGETKKKVQQTFETAAAVTGNLVAQQKQQKEQGNSDADLVRLGALTAVFLGGAVAVDMLSHHLTVNVFWV